MRGPDVRQHHRAARVGAIVSAGCAAAFGPSCTAALAATQPAELPSPAAALTAQPPLASGAAPLEQRWRGRLSTRERIDVRVRPDGRVLAVEALQRIVVGGQGDYSFAVPAPVEDVTPAAGSQSEPGLRDGAVLWQGFSAGRRLLSATLRLDPAAAGPVLPLRLELERIAPRRLRLTIANVTTTRFATYDAESVPATVAAALDATRADLRAGRPPRARPIAVRPPIRRRDLVVGASFRVRVAIEPPPGLGLVATSSSGLGASGTRGVIRGGDRATVEVTLSGPSRRLPSVRVTAVPVPPLELLEPPGAASWRELVRRGGPPADGRRLLGNSLVALLGIARARQYDRFVANPDPAGDARATFVLRVVEALPAAAPAPAGGGGGSTASTLLVLAVLLVALAAAGIAWAHS